MSDPNIDFLMRHVHLLQEPRRMAMMQNVTEGDVDEVVDLLREKHPDEYACLAEHLPLEMWGRYDDGA